MVDAEMEKAIFKIWNERDAGGAMYNLNHLPDANCKNFKIFCGAEFVGIIGYEQRVVDGAIRLTHSGVLPERRRRGIFRCALGQVEERIAKEFPNAKWIQETGPTGIIIHFEGLGFQLIKPGGGDNPTILRKKIQPDL